MKDDAKDAARYRWLRERAQFIEFITASDDRTVTVFTFIGGDDPSIIDGALDKSMEAVWAKQ